MNPLLPSVSLHGTEGSHLPAVDSCGKLSLWHLFRVAWPGLHVSAAGAVFSLLRDRTDA